MRTAIILIAAVALVLAGCATTSTAQTNQTVLYSFGTNGGTMDGWEPNGSLVFDHLGNLYGTTQGGGENASAVCPSGCGTVFEISPTANGWKETILHSFSDSVDGLAPLSGLIMDAQGNLYGTTLGGGVTQCQPPDCGTVFELSPQGNGVWEETTLYAFDNAPDGAFPMSSVTFDPAGNLYGTTSFGGSRNSGTVFELSPPEPPNDTWAEKILYSFCQLGGQGCSDGAGPSAGVTLDRSGNLYGTTARGGVQGEWGLVYELSPQNGGEWNESVLYKFPGEGVGGIPAGAVSFDAKGRLYGTIEYGGMKSPLCLENPIPPYVRACGGGFILTPKGNGRWAGELIFFDGKNGGNPTAGVTIDGSAIYGSTRNGGDEGFGVMFKFSGTHEAVLYTFCSQPECIDGKVPMGEVTVNNSEIYGATYYGGAYDQGLIYGVPQ